MEIHPLTACPGCGGDRSSAISLGGRHELRRCASCELVYAPEYADPDDVYTEGYLTGDTEFGLDLFHPLFQEFLAFAAAKRLDIIEALQPRRGRLLDVGCGSGEVLAVARDRGWEVAGAEPVPQSAEIARGRGLDVRSALLDDAGFEEASFDVVTAFHVLEHIPTGVAFLRDLARYARPGGLVVVEVPNWGSFDRERKGAEWPGVRPLEHVAHYDPATARRTLERAGLQPVEVRTLGFLWTGQGLDEQLADLARLSWSPRLRRFSRTIERDGRPTRIPGPLLRRGLLAVQALYDRMGKGQVVLGAARVPARS
jgi:SAM-dependent methyltransferase